MGPLLKIGTRRGGSAKLIIDVLEENEDLAGRSMFCIDPYGNIELECTNLNISKMCQRELIAADKTLDGDPDSKTETTSLRFDYNNDMRNQTIPTLYYYALSRGLNFTFFCLEDTEFFARYADGVPVYDQFKKYENEYAFVFFDGPHINEAVKTEVEFFVPRSIIGTVFVFDDIWMYDHNELIEPILFDNGFEIFEKAEVKASYKKVK